MEDLNSQTFCERPWGYWEVIHNQPGYKVKRLIVTAGKSLSYQMHYHRSEHWIVVAGVAKVYLDGKAFMLHENHNTFIPQASVHCLSNPGKIPLVVIEVQTGSYLEEDDIVRFESHNLTVDKNDSVDQNKLENK